MMGYNVLLYDFITKKKQSIMIDGLSFRRFEYENYKGHDHR